MESFRNVGKVGKLIFDYITNTPTGCIKHEWKLHFVLSPQKNNLINANTKNSQFEIDEQYFILERKIDKVHTYFCVFHNCFSIRTIPFAVNAKVHSPWTELNAYY